MKRRNLISLLLLLALSFGSITLYKNVSLSDRRQPSVKKHPVFWLSDKKLVLMTENDLVVRNIEAENVEEILFAMPEEFRETDSFKIGGCFTPSLWRLGWWRNRVGGKSSNTSSYEIYISNGSVTGFQKLPSNFPSVINPSDCSLVKLFGNEGLMASPKANYPPIKSRVRNTLFSAQEAQNVRVGSDWGFTIIEYENEGGAQRIELEPPADNTFRWDRWSRVVRAVNSPRYLFYGAGGDLGGKPDRWPMVTWIADLEQNTATRVELPRGNWVKAYSEKAGCYLVGCGVFRPLDLYLVGSKIYGHAWGIGYPSKVQGIYAFDLEAPDQPWKDVVRGVVAQPITFSPNGCKLAYAAPDLTVLDLC